MVWITIFCSFGCRFKTRETILWAGFLSPSGFFPNNSFASAPRYLHQFYKISMDIAACPPSMRLTVLTLIPTFLQEFPGINDSLFSFVEHVLLTGSAPVNPHGFPTQSPLLHREEFKTFCCKQHFRDTIKLYCSPTVTSFLSHNIRSIYRYGSFRHFPLLMASLHRLSTDCRQQNTNPPMHHRNIFPSVWRWLAPASDFPSSGVAFILI